MRVKQYSIRVFEINIESESDFIEFIEQNITIIKGYLLYLKGNISLNIETFLKNLSISYIKELNINKRNSKEFIIKKDSHFKVIDEVIRSGQEINYSGDILLLDRVNSGAKIKVGGNFISLSKVEGDIESEGNFMLLKITSKAKIIFNSMDITEELQENKFYEIRKKDNDIDIKEYLKDIKWE